MTIEPSNEVVEADAQPTGTNVEVAETEARADLVWDNEAPGLCVRGHGNGRTIIHLRFAGRKSLL
jgi:hypothetical protein